jgi:hypothetical protein
MTPAKMFDGDLWILASDATQMAENAYKKGQTDERARFYGQDKPTECAKGCPSKQICDYCQVVAPVRAMILAEREACAKVCEDKNTLLAWPTYAAAIRARGQE